MAVLQPQADIGGICDAPAKEGAVDLLLHHGEKQPCDVIGGLWLAFGGHRNGDGVRLIVVAGEEPAVVDLLQLHAVVVDHAVGGDRAAAVFNELPCQFLTVQRVQLIHACTAAVQIHVVVPADGGEVGKVGDDRGPLAAEGQVDEILQLEQLQLVGHRLKLCGFAGVEAVQPLGKVVQLLHIDREHFRALENSVEAVDLLHLAVRLDRVADLQCLQQLHAVRILIAGDGERDGRHTVFRVAGITENRLKHHVSFTPFSKFKTASLYLAISSAPVIRWNASSVTSSGDARSARVILQQPTAMAFAAW